jgi:hypothetical protein
MKSVFSIVTMLLVFQLAFSQESFHDHKRNLNQEEKKNDEQPAGFDWNKVFVGGTISLGYNSNTNGGLYSTNTFTIGAIPEIGYSINPSFDLGLSTTIEYDAVTSTYSTSKIHSTNYGFGAFARFYPLPNFFLQVMPEQDFINNKIISSGGTTPNNYQSTALLLGIGYGQREIGRMFYYTVIMLDVAKDVNSPYYAPTAYITDSYGNPYPTSVAPVPILRGGIGWYLGKRK